MMAVLSLNQTPSHQLPIHRDLKNPSATNRNREPRLKEGGQQWQEAWPRPVPGFPRRRGLLNPRRSELNCSHHYCRPGTWKITYSHERTLRRSEINCSRLCNRPGSRKITSRYLHPPLRQDRSLTSL